MDTHPLERVIWSALTTRHAALAEGHGRARRYPAAFAPFAATCDDSPASFAELARLLPAGSQAALFTGAEVTPGAGLVVARRELVDQMLGPTVVADGHAAPIEPLGEADAAEMRALVELTRPGPFSTRTHELGRFVGVRTDGRLVAMAGERMAAPGFTEISGVCVHPDARGHGHAEALTRAVAQAMLARGERPFLHVFSANAAAIALYHKLGFVRRCTLHLAVVEPAAG